jgi:hypothetical protein
VPLEVHLGESATSGEFNLGPSGTGSEDANSNSVKRSERQHGSVPAGQSESVGVTRERRGGGCGHYELFNRASSHKFRVSLDSRQEKSS